MRPNEFDDYLRASADAEEAEHPQDMLRHLLSLKGV